MTEPRALMNEKEKKYVSTCFRKNVLYKKGAVDFERIFNDEKIVYDFQNVQRNAEEKFGKQTKRSRKFLRKSASTESDFMTEQFIVVELLEMVSLIKFIVFDEENLEEMENAIVDYFTNNFKKIINLSKTFVFLNLYFSVASSNHKNKILKFMIENIVCIDMHKKLYEFLKKQNSANNLEIDIPVNIFEKHSGYTVVIYLLRSDLYKNKLYDLFLTKKLFYNVYLEELITLFNKLLESEEEKDILSKTLERIKDIRALDLLKRLKI